MRFNFTEEQELIEMAAVIRGLPSEPHAKRRLREAGYTEQQIDANITEVIKREVMRREAFMEKRRAI